MRAKRDSRHKDAGKRRRIGQMRSQAGDNAPVRSRFASWALCLLLPALAGAGPSRFQKVTSLADRDDFDGLALELASLDVDSLSTAQRSALAGTLSNAARRAGKDQVSIALFLARRAAELKPTLDRYGALETLARAAGDEPALVESLQGALRLKPDDGPALMALAPLVEKKDPAAALPLWRRALQSGGGEKASQAVARCQRAADDAERKKPKPARPLREIADDEDDPDQPAARQPAQAEEPFKLVYSDKGGFFPNREYGQKVVEVLERIRSFVCPRLGRCAARTVEVRLYTSEEYERKFAQRAAGRRAGFADGAVNVSYAQSFTQGLEEVLAHEFVHVALRHRVPSVPMWLNEGLASYLAGLYTGNGGGRAGYVPTNVCLGINAREAPRLSALDQKYPWAGSFGESRPGYDYSCAVARHLFGQGEDKVARLLELMERGKDVDAALQGAIGMDVEGLDKAARATLPP